MALKVRRTVTVVETWTVTFGEIVYPLEGVAHAPGSEPPPAPRARLRVSLSQRSVSTECVIILRPQNRQT